MDEYTGHTGYTPAAEHVRDLYIIARDNRYCIDADEALREWDRFIAARDAEVAANALRNLASDDFRDELMGTLETHSWAYTSLSAYHCNCGAEIPSRTSDHQEHYADQIIALITSTVEPSLPRNEDTDMTDHDTDDRVFPELAYPKSSDPEGGDRG